MPKKTYTKKLPKSKITYKPKQVIIPDIAVELEDNNLNQESMPKNGMSPEDAFNIQQEFRPFIGADPERGFSGIIEQDINYLDKATLQEDTHMDVIKIEDNLEKCIAFKREDAPSPVDTFDWDKFFSTTESSAQAQVLDNQPETRSLHEIQDAQVLRLPSPDLSTPLSHLPAPYPLAETSEVFECCNDRVLISPSPEPFTPPVQSGAGHSRNGYMLSPTPEPASDFNTSNDLSELAMDADVETPTNHLFRAIEAPSPEPTHSCGLQEIESQRIYDISATDLAPEAVTVSNSQDGMSLYEENMLSSAPSIWTSPPPRRSPQMARRADSSFNKPLRQQTRRQPLNRITKPILNRPQEQAVYRASSTRQRDRTTLRIRNKRTGGTMIYTAPKDMVPTVILQGGKLQISWTKGSYILP